MRRKRLLAALFFVLADASLAADRIRVGWYTGEFALAENPVFRTAGIHTAGTVSVLFVLARDGAIDKVEAIAGVPELQAVVKESIQTWHFNPAPSLPEKLQVYVYFTTENASGQPTPPAPPPPLYNLQLASLEIEGVPADEKEKLIKAMGLQPGTLLTEESYRRARTEAGKIDRTLLFFMTRASDGKPKIRIAPRS